MTADQFKQLMDILKLINQNIVCAGTAVVFIAVTTLFKK